jgi:hypothetical protein
MPFNRLSSMITFLFGFLLILLCNDSYIERYTVRDIAHVSDVSYERKFDMYVQC